jgi:hypothetical protein
MVINVSCSIKRGCAATGINAYGQDLSYFWERARIPLRSYINYVYKKLFPPRSAFEPVLRVGEAENRKKSYDNKNHQNENYNNKGGDFFFCCWLTSTIITIYS